MSRWDSCIPQSQVPASCCPSFGEKAKEAVIIHGFTVRAEWIYFLEENSQIGFMGMMGGFAAWLVWHYFPVD